MRLFTLPQLVVGVLLVAALTLFSFQAHVDQQELRRVEQRMHRFARLDAELDQGVVLVRQGLVNDYDALVATLEGMSSLVAELGEREAAVGAGDPRIVEAIDRLAADVAEKAVMIERLKSDMAVFKNSLSYFPTIIDEVGGGLVSWWTEAPALAESVHRLFRAVLVYAQPGERLSDEQVTATILRLESARGGAPEALRPLLTNALRHARLIVERKGRIEERMRAVLRVPTGEDGQRLLSVYTARFGERLDAANVYRRLLYLGSVALVLLIAYALFRLRQSAVALGSLNQALTTEMAVRRSAEAEQRRLAMAVEASPDGVAITDPEGAIVYVNPAFSEITGWSSADARGRNPRILKSGRMPEAFYRELWRTIGDGEVWKGRILNRRRGGRGEEGLYWAQSTISPIVADDGSLEGFVAVQVDVTEQVWREEGARLERRAADLEAKVGRILQEMRPLAERLDGALALLDELELLSPGEAVVLRLDPAVAAALGEALSGAARPRLIGDGEQTSAEEAAAPLSISLVPAGHPIGRLWLPATAEAMDSPVVAESLRRVGESIGMALLHERARADMERARRAAEGANRLKSDFLATMSHEIRTPMNAIIGMGELLMESPLNEEQRQYIRTLRSAGETLLYIIDDILDLSRVEAGRMSLLEKPFFLGEVVGHICAMMDGQARGKGLTLRCALPEGPTEALLGDAGRLQQVLFNLVGNAVKFTERGEVALRVVALGEADGRLEYHFQVEDSGPGVPAGMRDAIFDRFTQADTSVTRRHGGAGLGLTISRRLVELMEGRIWLESEVGRGSTFHFTVRFPRAGRPPSRPLEVASAAPSAAEPASRRRLLLVEDSPDNRTLILHYLKREPYRVECAEHGLEALERLREHPFDLVLMDMQMPVMDGYSATRELRRREREEGHRRTPVVALTAHALKGDEEKSRAAGCDDHLTKPIKKQVLLEALRRHLGAG